MRRRVIAGIGVLCAVPLLTACFPPLSHGPTIPGDSTQMITVVADSWSSTTATLYLDQRARGGAWTWTGFATPVDLGPSGLGWGAGLQYGGQGPQKREGDGRSPAGVFHLGLAFGYAPFATRMQYLVLVPQDYCNDDSSSPAYNHIVDTRIAPTGVNPEPMLRPDGQYQLGLVVQHNPADAPGLGSCIFLHVWRGLGLPTAGCTAMDATFMAGILGWLDPARDPVLVQMPVDQYRSVESDWGLPAR